MNQQTIEFGKRRDFGNVIGDAFQFVAKNFKSLIAGFLLYVGPFLLVGLIAEVIAFKSLGFWSLREETLPEDLAFQFVPGLVVMVIFLLIASILLTSFIYAAIQKYQDEQEEPIIDNLWPYVRRNVVKVTVVMIALVFIFAVLAAILGVAASVGGRLMTILVILISIPLFVYLVVPFTLLPYIYVNERVDLPGAVGRAFFLIRNKWWITFATIIVLGIIASLVAYLFIIPLYVILFALTLGSGEDLMASGGLWFGIIYALTILGSMLGSLYQQVGIVLHYYSLVEQKEGTELRSRIEQLGEDD